jgi:hypothetical protein
MDAGTHEFEVAGKRYRAKTLSGKAQFHITRRLAPVLSSLKDLIGGGGAIGALEDTEGAQAAAVIGAASPFLEAIAKMSDEDVDYIIDRCLEVTWRLDERGGAQSMWNTAARRPMFDDLSMMEMLGIVWSVIQGSASLMGFSNELLFPSKAA